MHRFDREQLAAAPWKNGGGSTREIVRMPAGSDMESFDWRVSIAEISMDGEFSRFPGVDRVIVLLEGNGVYMHGVERRLDTTLVPFSFAGEAPISATLLGGASTDFNVMTRRDRLRADVRVIREPCTLPESRAGVLFAAHGSWDTLDAGTGVWWNDEPRAWQLTPTSANAALIAVGIFDA